MLISQVISLTFNSAQAEFHLHRQMASCILSTSKYFQYLKITCPICPQRHGENRAPKSAFFVKDIRLTGCRKQCFINEVFSEKTKH